jgi:hypothetical protein
MPSLLESIVIVLVVQAVKLKGCSARAAGIARKELSRARAVRRRVL